MRRTLVVVLLIAAIIGPVSATGTQEQTGSETTELRVTWWGSQVRHDLTLEVIALFEERNPGVTVQPEFSGWGGYWERLATQAAGGQLPDVVQTAIASGWGNQYAEQGLFADIYPMIERGWMDMSDVEASTLAQNEVDGKLAGIPLGVNAPVIMYDAGLLEAAGMEAPDENWTFDEFGAFANDYAARSGKYGIDLFKGMNDLFPVYLRNQGFSFVDASANELGYQDSHLVDFWTLLLDMQENGGTVPPDVMAEHEELDARLILTGESAMTFSFSNQVGVIVSGATGPVGMAMLPGPNQDRGMFVKSSLDFSIATNPGTEEWSARFVDFFTNDHDANLILGAERGVPISSEIRDLLSVDASETLDMTLDFIGRVASLSPPPLDAPHPAFAELTSLFDDIEAQVRYFRLTPEQGARQFRTEAEAVLQRVGG